MGFDFLKSSKIIIISEILGSFFIIGLITFAWLTVDKPIQYIYNATPQNITFGDDVNEGKMEKLRQTGLEGCVITWCLTILLVLCGSRIISAIMLSGSCLKKSALLLQYWICYKCLILMVSSFVFVTSFTSAAVIPGACASLILDLVTFSFFIRVLIPELEIIIKQGKVGTNKFVNFN